MISRVVTDVDQISDGLLIGFTQLFSGAVTIVGTLIFMFGLNVRITLIVILVTPISLLVANFVARRTFSMFKAQSETRGEMTSLVEETVGGQNVVKVFSREETCEARFDEINERLRVCGIRALFFSSITNPCTRFVNSIVYACVGVFGAIAAISRLAQRGHAHLLPHLREPVHQALQRKSRAWRRNCKAPSPRRRACSN